MSKPLPIKKLAEVLDEIANGLSYEKIGFRTNVATSTVFNIAKEFPLWNWYRENKSGSSGQT